MAASVAITTFFDGAQVAFVDAVAQFQGAEAGEKVGVAGVARRHDAVEHVDATPHAFYEVFRFADAHQVARFVRGQVRQGVVEGVVARFQRFADRQPADGIAGQVERDQAFRRFAAQVGIDAALDDAEKVVGVAFMCGFAARRPAQRQAHGFGGFFVCRRVGGAFVELHDDVGIERALHLHGALRAEEDFAAVHRRAETCAFFGQLADFCQTEDLKTAGIGEDGFVPVHELVQTAVRGDDVFAGAQHEVEGVAEDDFRADGVQLFRREAFHGAEGADRHEDRRLHDLAVREGDGAATRVAILGDKCVMHGVVLVGGKPVVVSLGVWGSQVLSRLAHRQADKKGRLAPSFLHHG
ncbi:hypothetical protein HMPREF9080_02979 [Cardiobacterium valvarum F0432]|uniref:Uncharacterized protein n=1 Tax=Cardiobacterium valvarum F0432 TaxID=797473 RepID=G9ZJK9_9GAMM|nr:hypothetical protein HMPREF9080_02979 [Cardiobacterium valvarum F0432]